MEALFSFKNARCEIIYKNDKKIDKKRIKKLYCNFFNSIILQRICMIAIIKEIINCNLFIFSEFLMTKTNIFDFLVCKDCTFFNIDVNI